MKWKQNTLVLILCMLLLDALAQPGGFVTVKQSQFFLNGQPYYFVGTNYWYGSYLLINGNEEANKKRLLYELDFMKANGISNLRVLAATEGAGYVNGVLRTMPAFQTKPGVFEEKQLKALDFLLDAMRQRGMKAVIFLSNNWEWSGGFLQYVNWHGGIADSVLPRKLNWDEQRDYTSKFYSCEACKKDYLAQVKLILSHVNSKSGIPYIKDPAIMAWEIANEPRPMRPAANTEYAVWLNDVAAYIKSKDKMHLLTIGNEGEQGTENMELYKSIHANKNIDYLTIHIWPKNWGWFSDTAIEKSFDQVCSKTNDYISKHQLVAKELKKPLVLEEFGMPRDGHSFEITSTTYYRNRYYQLYFDRVINSAKNRGAIAGLNFWVMGGAARPKPGQLFWKKGDDYMGDPPAEEQGLNTVFDSDTSTWKIVKAGHAAMKNNLALHSMVDANATAQTKTLYHKLFNLQNKGVMFGHQDDWAYGVGWKYVDGRSDIKAVTGDYPAVYGWDLGRLELDWKHNLDSVPFDSIRSYVKKIYKQGAISTISWHLNNPLTGKDAWDAVNGTVASILPGAAKHDLYKAWLDKIALFLGSLKDENNVAIPVIFRPFHELNGNWFWWGGSHCSADEFKTLWKFTVSYLRDEKGLHNLLYAFNTDRFSSKEDYLTKYPGDEWVDIIGFDIYQREHGAAANQKFATDLSHMLGMLTEMAAEKNKLAALTEFGYPELPDSGWWTATLWKALQQHKISYALAWRNAGKKQSGEVEYYVPYKGQQSAKDFKRFYELPQTLFQRDVKGESLYR